MYAHRIRESILWHLLRDTVSKQSSLGPQYLSLTHIELSVAKEEVERQGR